MGHLSKGHFGGNILLNIGTVMHALLSDIHSLLISCHLLPATFSSLNYVQLLRSVVSHVMLVIVSIIFLYRLILLTCQSANPLSSSFYSVLRHISLQSHTAISSEVKAPQSTRKYEDVRHQLHDDICS